MGAATETIRETPKILFINLIEDSDHGLLNNLVLQGRDPKRPLPTIRFWDENSSRWLRSISAAVNPAVQIDKPTFQSGLIPFPRDTVHPGSSLTLQRVKTILEQADGHMVKQSGGMPIRLRDFLLTPAPRSEEEPGWEVAERSNNVRLLTVSSGCDSRIRAA